MKHPMSDEIRRFGDGWNMKAAEELDRMHTLLNTPEIETFIEAVKKEAAHQVERWKEYDDRKEPQDWFWLIGYLAGKALRAHLDEDFDKAKHHTISSAAALLNWHRRVKDEEAGRALRRHTGDA